eukprot:Amastigsp_a336_1242.p3 type:complete len:143 gc:universal Amastigsp_a336_1242:222-650(+)
MGAVVGRSGSGAMATPESRRATWRFERRSASALRKDMVTARASASAASLTFSRAYRVSPVADAVAFKGAGTGATATGADEGVGRLGHGASSWGSRSRDRERSRARLGSRAIGMVARGRRTSLGAKTGGALSPCTCRNDSLAS